MSRAGALSFSALKGISGGEKLPLKRIIRYRIMPTEQEHQT